jgi:hypothetical protein
MSHSRTATLLLILLLCTAGLGGAQEAPPGTVIHHVAAESKRYVGSPSLCVLPNGDYLASHDLFGPESNEHKRPIGRIYRSKNRGKTWKHVTDIEGFFWTSLFVHWDKVFALGTDSHHGRLVIRSSEDGGRTWTEAAVIAEGEWATAPVPIVNHEGRLWRAVEDAHTGSKWGERYRARMISAPVESDLMLAESWTVSNALPRDPEWLKGKFGGWLEGNAVVAPNGKVVGVLRVAAPKLPERAAIVRLSRDGKAATFDPAEDFVELPGGSKKFTIRKDPEGGGYWTLANIIPSRHGGQKSPASLRNTLALLHSSDLRSWTVRTILLYHPDVGRHAFQYADWHFDGDDLIAVSRTAYDDEHGGAHNAHDANYLTFHRWKDFRDLQREDDAPLLELPSASFHKTRAFAIEGPAFEVGSLANGERAFSNRKYVLENVPTKLRWKSFTRLPGGARTALEITTRRTTKVLIATAVNQEPVDMGDWKRTKMEFGYTDRGHTKFVVFERTLRKGKTLRLPRGNWTGSMLIFDD